MNEFIREAYEYIILALLVFTVFISTALLIMNSKFAKLLTSRKYRISTHNELEPISGNESFSIHIYNNNLTDARLAGVGYVYKHQTIDYYKTYLKQIDYSLEGKIVIPSRDSIKIKVDINPLLAVINDYNQGKLKVKRLECYVTDSLGLTTKVNAKTVRKVIKKKLKNEKANQKEQKSIARDNLKTERTAQKKLKRELRKDKRRTRRARVRITLKERINKLRRRTK